MRENQDNNNYNYDGSVLLRARKRLKINRESAAKALTLNLSLIKSIEENNSYGFATPYFRKLAIERYAKFLNISINKIIFYQEDAPINLDSVEPSPQRFFEKILNQMSTLVIIFLGILSAFLFFSYSYISYDKPENKELLLTNEINDPSDNIESFPMIIANPEETNNTLSQPIIDTNQNFICTIQSSPVTSFTTNTPDKPSSYFHLEALVDHSICTIDSKGNLKTYNLIAGDKLTHRGSPPFKIQLEPSAGTLYFQGWIVYLRANNKFIQLDPALPSLTD